MEVNTTYYKGMPEKTDIIFSMPYIDWLKLQDQPFWKEAQNFIIDFEIQEHPLEPITEQNAFNVANALFSLLNNVEVAK